jgi:uncharacterized protein YbjT (DUF2867 family)
MSRKATVAGASGLIGAELLKIILKEDDYDSVTALTRRKLDIVHPKLTQLIVDFDHLSDFREKISGDAVFSCLGTTNQITPDKKRYYQIDHDYPLHLGRMAEENKIPHFHLVSSIGANPKSKNFYTRMKGETERDIAMLNIPSVYFYEPSLLKGRQTAKRSGEKFFEGLFKIVDPLLLGSWKKYRSVEAATVARAMYDLSLESDPGKYIVQFLAGEPRRVRIK